MNRDKIQQQKHESYLRNRGIIKQKARDKKRLVAEFIKKYKGERGCAWCPETDRRCLDFHHLDPSQKDINIGQVANNGWNIERVLQEISKCILICANCHRKTHTPL